MEDADIARACEQEITRLHRFFTDWFRGAVPDTDAAWAPVTRVLAPEFTLVSPEGHVFLRDTLVAGIRARHGSHAPTRDFEISIRDLVCRRASGGTVLATYEEWHRRDGEERGRVSTAVLEPDPTAPHGLRWIHVHETWLPTAG